ncbi:threonine synthase [Pontibacillus halophilus JSM 076056 = DSM 19796]|uniref:Threonine synthase n=1 Tax=Pontibacillus halophilus JSM 076056 = DSM 19796 TaxID=1385510 RepID=A0A0A5I187_9BACI|nr:threonine synthase [Pontibacillus halophilus]KGX89627.1 threonine synthase [Pontibacillus halophilus JSM 076056 = DSM 19796]
MGWNGLLQAYKSWLPITENTPLLTLHEGNTPLMYLEKLSKELNIEAYAKVEGANPTGSFKDRGMVMAMAKALEEGSTGVVCASTGNTSASAAAFAARAGLRCIIVIPNGKIAQGKLAQAVMYGAEIYAIDGNFDNALTIVKRLAEEEGLTLVNSVNPYRIEGQKTGAFEVCDGLERAPDSFFIPVGNAGNITAYWKGFKEYHEKKGTGLPRMYGFEASGSAAIVRNEIIDQPETLATAIRIGNPASWKQAVEATEQSAGSIGEVTDDEIVEAYKWLARNEGIFAEPASCASIAGVFKAYRNQQFQPGEVVVSVLTGNGLKDPVTAVDVHTFDSTVIANEYESVKAAVKGKVLQ